MENKHKEIDPDQRDWMYDGLGNKVDKKDYTKMWEDDYESLLKRFVCDVIFTKVNGEERKMRCTLVESYLPAQTEIENHIQKKSNPDVLPVWDLDKQAWRSFRKENVKLISVISEYEKV